MKKHLLLLGILALCFLQSKAQNTGCDILVQLRGCNVDTLWFGHSMGKRAVPEFFGLKQADGFYRLQSDQALNPDLYAIIYKRGANGNYQFFSCWLSDNERQFSLKTDMNHIYETMVVSGSKENELYYDYLNRYTTFTERLDSLTKDWKELLDENSFNAKVAAEEDLRQFQEDFIKNNPNTLSAKLVEKTMFITPPIAESKKYSNYQDASSARFQWYRAHYFERLNIDNDDFLKYPLWIDRADFYFSLMPPPIPDSMKLMVEDIFHKLAPNEAAYRYYFPYVMNSLARISRYQTDEVYVQLVHEYIETGKADWLKNEELLKYKNDAQKMEPIFKGKKIPDLVLYDKNDQPFSIRDSIQANYTLMVFWLYDCSHCKKELPILKKLYEKYQSRGLKVISVCGKYGADEMPKCWEFADQIGMPSDWKLLSDPNRRSRFATILNIRSFPCMIILDGNKNIIYKQLGEVSELTLTRNFERLIK